jgi:secreted PhoX family phosphatase
MSDQDRHAALQTFEEVVAQRVSRRTAIKAGLVATTAPFLGGLVSRTALAAGDNGGTLPFTAIEPQLGDQVVVAAGHRSQVLVRWGDPLVAGLSPFDIESQTAEEQELRFGFNCDYLSYLPLGTFHSGNPNHGLLWVNHEYTDGAMMFPGYDPAAPTAEQVAIELAAHGASIIEVTRGNAGWRYHAHSRRNRRITGTTPMQLSGPAAGHARLKTGADPTGTTVLGMLNNCGGGTTPWGTVITAEENFNQYFGNAASVDPASPEGINHKRYGVTMGASERRWEEHVDRFDVAKEPNEPFRFGWIVEVDPYDPSFTPRKRTALGRLKHEAANGAIADSGQYVVYTGDDERFEFVYKFVTAGVVDKQDQAANRELLDEGTLYAARFDADGSGSWLPLVWTPGGPLAAAGFTDQADVLIRAREAATVLGATKMDRPEDIETSPVTGKVYVALTNNTRRGTGTNPGTDPANPRANNKFGHVIELAESGGDYAATSFEWDILLLCGLPDDPSTYFAGYPKDQVSPISSPDNVALDRRGNLWIATDGQPGTIGWNDAVHALPIVGAERGHLKQFLSGVTASEVASLVFNTNEKALFVSIQHPGEGGSIEEPTSHWPDGGTSVARPSVIVVTHQDGRVVGS